MRLCADNDFELLFEFSSEFSFIGVFATTELKNAVQGEITTFNVIEIGDHTFESEMAS